MPPSDEGGGKTAGQRYRLCSRSSRLRRQEERLQDRPESAEVGNFGVEADVDVLALDLCLVPLNELLVVFLEAHCGRSEEQTAQLVGLFKHDGDVALLLEDESCLQTADTGADDGDLLGALGGGDVETGVLINGDERRFLETTQTDELWKMW